MLGTCRRRGGLTGGTRLAFEDLFGDDDRFGDGGTVEIDGVVVCDCGTASRQRGRRRAWGIDHASRIADKRVPGRVARTVSTQP